MITKIIRFEFLERLKNPFTYILFVILAAQGIWYNIGFYNMETNVKLFMNAPAAIYLNIACMGMLGIVISGIIAASALGKDLQAKTAEIMYASPINDKGFFVSKSISAILINIVLFIGYPLGMLLLPYIGIGAPEQFGPAPVGQMIHAFIIFTIPNLLLMTIFPIFLVVFFRKAAAAFIGTASLFFMVMVGLALKDSSTHVFLLSLIDPFGYVVTEKIINSMSIVERNAAYLPLNTAFLINRLICLSLTGIMFVIAFKKFNFKYFIKSLSTKQNKIQENINSAARPQLKMPAVTPVFSVRELLRKSLRLAWLELKNITRPVVFRIVMLLLFVMFVGYNFIWNTQYYITTSHLPLTYIMSFVRAPMGVVLAIFIMLWAGEVLFKDRKSGIWQITDAMPAPTWVFVLSRFTAMSGVALLVCTVMLGAGLFAQITQVFFDIEWGLYFKDIYLSRFGLISFMHLIALAFFAGTFFNNRIVGHITSIAIFLFLVISAEFGLIEQLRFLFPFTPGVEDYSEMNGYGIFDKAMPWYAGAWSALAALFLLFTVKLWNRGIKKSVKERFLGFYKGFNTGFAIVFFLFLGLFIAFEYIIHRNVHQLAGFQTSGQKNAEAADYEEKYLKYSELPQPKIVDINMKLDINPAERRAKYNARLLLLNKTGQAIDTLHINWKRFLTIDNIKIENRDLELIAEDKSMRYAIYNLSHSLKPGEKIVLTAQAELHYKGFHQNDPQADLTYNGSFLGADMLPYFGYDEKREVENNIDRLGSSLAIRKSRMADWNDLFSRGNLVQSDQADKLSWDIVVSTSGEQQIVCPGLLIKSWKKSNKNYFQYKSGKPGFLNFHIASAGYSKKVMNIGKTQTTIYYHPRHTYNIEHIQKAVQESFLWLSEKFGEYPYASLNILEKPFYNENYVTYHNVIAISENHGWTADTKEPEDLEYIYYSIAYELAKHWAAAKLMIADVQGAGVFTDSIPEYAALIFMDQKFGHQELKKWFTKKYADYEKGKGDESIKEPLLLRVDDVSYVSRNKGGWALYSIAQQAGVTRFNEWLGKWLLRQSQNSSGDFVTSGDFYNDLKKWLPVSRRTTVEEWFENRIHYRIKLQNVSVNNNEIVLKILSEKINNDGIGNLTKKTVDEWIEVGLHDENEKIKEIKKIRLMSGLHNYSLNSEFKPVKIVLDPYYWYIIENRKSNSQKKVN